MDFIPMFRAEKFDPDEWAEWLKALFHWLTLGRIDSIIEMITIKLNRVLS